MRHAHARSDARKPVGMGGGARGGRDMTEGMGEQREARAMANLEHLQIWQGVEVWNAWREENADILPDLSNADLDGANLDGANINRANLAQ